MIKFSEFLQGPEGEASSKRLAGLLATIVLLILSFVGGMDFIKKEKTVDFLNLIDTLAFFASGMLGLGIADILLKKKYGNNSKKSDSN